MSTVISDTTTTAPSPADAADRSASRPRRRLRALVRGKPTDAAWVRPSLLGLLALTGVLYLWGLGASGWANGFYSAAVQAGTKSWKAFFFGSFDSSNFITVDKPPASLWVMDLSARIFGVNAWSILVPQALEGVAAVGLLYAAIRRRFSAPAALLAGAVLAVTPVATLMFRFNNPDALLVLLLVGAAYAMTRAFEDTRTRWLVLCGALIGFAFLAKMLQAFLVVPAFGLVYLVTAATPFWRRIRQLLAAGIAMVVAAGWWVAVVTLWPAASRPYIGGSQTNSVLELILGYNGLGRLTGNETGSVGGGVGPAGTTGMWGPTGWGRMFNAQFGGQVAWLIPAALILFAGTLWLWRRAPRTDRRRAAVLMWGGWLLITAAVFSFAKGIIHPYYSVALAPAIGALVGVGGVSLWRAREHDAVGRFTLAVAVAVTAVWSFVLLDRSPTWLPWLRVAVLMLGLGSAVAIAAGLRLKGRAVAAVAIAALTASLAGPLASSVSTAATAHTGAIPSAGPAVASGFAPGTGPGANGGPGGFLRPGGGSAGPPQGGFAGGPPGGSGGGAGGGFPGGLQPPTGVGPGASRGGPGGLLDARTPAAALVRILQRDSGSYTWVAATVGANAAAGIQLATDDPIMAIGGFNGSDPTPTLAQFERLVSEKRIHYFIGGGSGGFGGPAGGSSSTSSQIATWVASHFTARTSGNVTIYDLTSPTG